MVLGQPTPSFGIAVEMHGSNITPESEYIVTNKRPRRNFRSISSGYDILVGAFGIDDSLFTREQALDVLSNSGFMNQGSFIFDDLLEHESVELVR